MQLLSMAPGQLAYSRENAACVKKACGYNVWLKYNIVWLSS